MKSHFRNLSVIVILLAWHVSVIAQESKSFDLLKDDVESELPPLSMLIDSAIIHNPYVKFRDNQKIISQENLRINQKQWTRNLGFQSDIRYGTFNNFNNYTTGAQSPDVTSTLTTEFNYGIGAYIRIPFEDIFNRKHQVTTAKMQLVQAENMANVQKDELRQVVIRQYNEVILRQRLMKIKSKYLEIQRFNMETSEKDFHSGASTVTDYSRVAELLAMAESDFQTTKVEFNTAYLILQEIVGFKFNLNNSIKN
ncbi:MAG: TolC family protein [Prolixibacteraceae bacterium]